MDGGARISGAGGVETTVLPDSTAGASPDADWRCFGFCSGSGSWAVDFLASEDVDVPGFALSRCKPASPSEGFDALEVVASLSRSDGSSFPVGAFSPSFCFRLASRTAFSLELLPAASGAPPSSPSRGYSGSTRISDLRCGGTFSQGQSRKKSVAEKCAMGGQLSAGYAITRSRLEHCSSLQTASVARL